MDKERGFALARSAGWLAEIAPDIQNAILARCDLIQVAGGASLFNAGDDPGGLFGVLEGSIKLYLLSPDGDHGLSHIGGPGFWAGDAAAITGRTRRITISAATDSWLLRLPRSGLLSISEEQPVVWRHLANLVSLNLLLAMDIIDALKRRDPAKRVAATILNLAGREATAKGSVTMHVSQADLGAIALLSRAGVNGIVAEFQQRGWLQLGYASMTVTDLSALSAFVQGD